MKIEPVSMRMLLMPLNSAMAQNVLRHASSASLNSERLFVGVRDGALPIRLWFPSQVCSIERGRIPDDELNVVHPLGSRKKENPERISGDLAVVIGSAE